MAREIRFQIPDLTDIRTQTRRTVRTVLLTLSRELRKAADAVCKEEVSNNAKQPAGDKGPDTSHEKHY